MASTNSTSFPSTTNSTSFPSRIPCHVMNQVESHIKRFLNTSVLSSFCVVAVGKDCGFLSDLFRINVNKKHQFALKMLPIENKEALAMITTYHLHIAELEFFASPFSTDFSIPQFIGGAQGNNPQSFYILMKWDNRSMPSFHDGLSIDQAKSVLEAIANLHKQTKREKCREKKLGYFEKMPLEKHRKRQADLFLDCFERCDDLMQTLFESRLAQKDLQMIRQVYKQPSLLHHILEVTYSGEIFSSKKFPLALIHGDLWSGNVLIDKKTNATTLLDWQFTMIANPMVDLSIFLATSVNANILMDNLNLLLKHYYDASTPLYDSFEQCQQAFDECWVVALLMAFASVDCWIGDQPNKNVLARYDNIIQQASRILFNHQDYQKYSQ